MYNSSLQFLIIGGNVLNLGRNLKPAHMRTSLSLLVIAICALVATGAEQFVTFQPAGDSPFAVVENAKPVAIYVDPAADEAVKIAARSLAADFARVTGTEAILADTPQNVGIITGTIGNPLIDRLIKEKRIDGKELKGKREKYLLQVIDNPAEGIDRALVIAGSDRRGTVYGIYELSRQMGVSPWYWWADAPVTHRDNVYVTPGVFTDGEPAVKYRGIFLNDEAPCLTSWVKNHYGTSYGDHRFYADVFELLLRLKANFMWPAMWGWAFYADDPENSATADRMGIIMGTSHHEPMGRNHQEYARHRDQYGAWNYNTNSKNLDRFFADGIRRLKDTEDIVTIGMRGDGDEAMGDATDIELMERIVANQRKIIARETGKNAKERPQVWALYKEVLDYYDGGMRVPDDVIMLLCDDNWGNVRRLPDAKERQHPGGWGMYYHVDYVGAPRNSKWINVTPVQNMWEQLKLTYDYGVDRLWILNVGDLKPMEYPITLFLDMAWNPDSITVNNLKDHTRDFCRAQFGDRHADEAARIINLYSKYNGRVTPEMLDASTYNIATGEWKQVADDYARLEVEALRLYLDMEPEYRDAYRQLVLFPVQAMSNLYEMYYSQAMNRYLYAQGDPEADRYADNVERCFTRDAELCRQYNEDIAGGKWRGMMTQKHIGYTSWNDNFPADILPEVKRIGDDSPKGGYTFAAGDKGYIAIEAEHFNRATDAPATSWTVIPDMGRTLSGIAAMPYTTDPAGASLSYRMMLPDSVSTVNVTVVVKSTLAFKNREGHRYTVGFDGTEPATVNFNANLNEAPENIYDVFYPTVARRVVESKVPLDVTRDADGYSVLTLAPLDPGVVFEKIVVDFGGYEPSYLHGTESPKSR